MDDARRAVAAFGAGGGAAGTQTSPRGWNITRTRLEAQLVRRLSGRFDQYPNQSTTSRCGPAAFLYCLLKDRPDLYVRYAVALWEQGRFDLRNGPAGKSFVVAPHDGTVRSMPVDGEAKGQISELDWITMGSLSKPDGSADPGDELTAITLPNDIIGWFAAAGAPLVQADINSFISRDVHSFRTTMRHWGADTWIVWEVNPRILNPSGYHFYDRHWLTVTRTTPPTLNGRSLLVVPPPLPDDVVGAMRLSVSFATWGTEDYHTTPAGKTLNDVLGWYYGGAVFPKIP